MIESAIVKKVSLAQQNNVSLAQQNNDSSNHILATLESTYELAQKNFNTKLHLLSQDLVLANDGGVDDYEKQGQEVLAAIKSQFKSRMNLAEQDFANVKKSLANTAKAQQQILSQRGASEENSQTIKSLGQLINRLRK